MTQMQGEIALVFARCASLSVEQWGAVNNALLRDAKVLTHKHDMDARAIGGGTVLDNLVRFV